VYYVLGCVSVFVRGVCARKHICIFLCGVLYKCVRVIMCKNVCLCLIIVHVHVCVYCIHRCMCMGVYICIYGCVRVYICVYVCIDVYIIVCIFWVQPEWRLRKTRIRVRCVRDTLAIR